MDIIKDKNFNVLIGDDDDRIFIIPTNENKPIKYCYENPNRQTIVSDDCSIIIEDTVSFEWLVNHVANKEDYEKIENALKEVINREKFTAYEVR